MRCVGCHAGHTMIPVPASDEAAQWTNLAPGATVSVSSTANPDIPNGLNDRLVLKGSIGRYWHSAADQPANGQWAQLTLSAGWRSGSGTNNPSCIMEATRQDSANNRCLRGRREE